MSLKTYQKSIYFILFNATMISRSVGKTIKGRKDMKYFKLRLFKKLDNLTTLMDNKKLTENNILKAIENLANEFRISFGQAQKAINVILKYHFYLTNNKNIQVKKALYCPLDSIILKALKKRKFLTNINKEEYLEIQNEIAKRCFPRIDFDKIWEKQLLQKAGL